MLETGVIRAPTVAASSARADDTDTALERRMLEYREKTLPVTDFYKRRGILARVDADRGTESVFEDVSRLIIE